MNQLSITVFLLLFSLASTQDIRNSILVDAVGESEVKAIKNALSKAVEQSVGVLVESETLVENYQVVKDKILTYSDGFVDDYRVISSVKEGSHWLVQLEASVAQKKLREKIETIGIPTRKVSGQKIFAEAITKSTRDKDALQLLSSTFEKSINDVLEFQLGNPKIKSTQGDIATIEVLVGVRWKTNYWKKMESIISQVSSSSTQSTQDKRIDEWLVSSRKKKYCANSCATISIQENKGNLNTSTENLRRKLGVDLTPSQRTCKSIGVKNRECKATTYFLSQTEAQEVLSKFRGGGNSSHSLRKSAIGFESPTETKWMKSKIISGEKPDLWEVSFFGGSHTHIDIKQPSTPWYYFVVTTDYYIEDLKEVETIHFAFIEERK